MRNALLLILLFVPAAQAADWTLRLEGNWVEAYGHDQHALTIHDRDTSATPITDNKRAIEVEVPGAVHPGFALRRMTGATGFGLDVFWYGVTADAIRPTASGTATNEIVFEASDQSYSSSAPTDVLYYRLREDNRLEVWTADFVYLRSLSPALELQLGVRFGDFDNDYRAVLGVEGSEGTFLDTSSNYPRMMGPIVGFSGRFTEGRHRFEGYLGQSLILGRASLKYQSRHFTGTPSAPTVDDLEFLQARRQAAIPITELRLRYAFDLTAHWSVGTGASTSAWWDVPVPPGVIPGTDADGQLLENTLVFYSVLANVEWRF